MRTGIIIPARYNSSRLPGKPLIDICGKTLIQRTWEQCTQAIGIDSVTVATDDERIAAHLSNIGAKYILTNSRHLTGTDRIAEANESLNLDLVINVQGDEPIIDPRSVSKFVNFARKNQESVTCACSHISDQSEFESPNVPKFVLSTNMKLIYASRAPVPGSKNGQFFNALKQVGIYGIPKTYLRKFSSHNSKTANESIEDIEILRFIELDIPVIATKLNSENISVDTSHDVDRVITSLRERNLAD